MPARSVLATNHVRAPFLIGQQDWSVRYYIEISRMKFQSFSSRRMEFGLIKRCFNIKVYMHINKWIEMNQLNFWHCKGKSYLFGRGGVERKQTPAADFTFLMESIFAQIKIYWDCFSIIMANHFVRKLLIRLLKLCNDCGGPTSIEFEHNLTP